MKPLRIRPLAALGALAVGLALGGCASGGDSAADSCAEVPDYDTRCSQRTSSYRPPEEQWKEADAVMPPLPRDDDLVRIEAPEASASFDYFVDRTSVRRGSDDVMRYVVVVRSRTGASNVFYEGLRCLTDETKIYGMATRGGTMQPARGSQWQPIVPRGARAYQQYLASRIMCGPNGYAWDADRAVKALSGQYTAGGVRIERFCRDSIDCEEKRN